MKLYLALILFLPLHVLSATDSVLLPPDDPRQSIAYWKIHAISALEDKDVELAESILSRLLRAWDNSRVQPGLYVVRSNGAAWAASLADGNILLSREAIDASFKFGRERGQHLLAFVLAHELAHQRSDDLWHQRFFRSLRKKDVKDRALMLNGLPLGKDDIADIERKEVQADHDGLVMMSSVGFDPWQVLADKDFFTTWVESIWREACDSKASIGFKKACRQARSRALRTRSQLDTVASQSAVYDMGIQALVANNYVQARHYFTLFGREYPNRNVMSAIGLSYLSEALSIHRHFLDLDVIDRIDFYYPLLLDASAGIPEQSKTQALKRSANSAQTRQLEMKLSTSLEQAAEYLQKAIQLDPDHRLSYLSLAMVHLIENNPYLVRGVLQGRYVPRFGEDASVSMLLAMIAAQQGDYDQAQRRLKNIINRQLSGNPDEVLPADILSYASVYNLAELYEYLEQPESARILWQDLAQKAQSAGKTLLFRLALNKLSPASQSGNVTLSKAPAIKGVRLGDRKPRDDTPHRVSELWIEGEQYHVYIYEDGARYISASNGKVVSASQVGGFATIEGLIDIGGGADRPLKTLGPPDRRLHLSSGEYLAYDDYRLALHIYNNRVQGWFLYP